MLRVRVRYFALALATIIVGLLVHTQGNALGSVSRDVLGDALWGAMIVWLVSVAAPQARLAFRIIAAYLVCVTVEVSQLFHTPALDAVRATFVGRLVLGSGFDPRDLAAYALGIAVAALLETLVFRRGTATVAPIH